MKSIQYTINFVVMELRKLIENIFVLYGTSLAKHVLWDPRTHWSNKFQHTLRFYDLN